MINEQIWTPDQEFAKGHGKVELFDARGRLDQSVEVDNAIMNVQLDHARWRTRKAFAERNTGYSWPGKFLDIEPDNWMWRNNDPYDTGMATDRQANFLTTSDERPVDATQDGIYGLSNAWCSKYELYSGLDTRRGSVNLPESLWSPTTARWVMDWPTHAGNGTFRSLCWGRFSDRYAIVKSIDSARDARMAPNPQYGDLNSQLSTLRYLSLTRRPGTDELWFRGYDPYNGSWWVGWQDISILSGGAPVDRPWSWNIGGSTDDDLRWRPDGTLWFRNSSTSLQQRDPATGTVLATHTLPNLNPSGGGYYVRAYVFTSDTEMWATDNSVNPTLHRLTRSGTTWTEASTLSVTSTGILPWGIDLHPSGDLLIHDGSSVVRIGTDGTVRWMAFGIGSSGSYQKSIFHIPGTTDDYATGQYNAMTGGPWLHLWRPGGLAVRALLPTAVTKTNLQTMKITYTFTFS